MTDGWATQAAYDVRFEWGQAGVRALGFDAAAMAIVDVLRFTTAVEAALSRGGRAYPYRSGDASAAEFAQAVGALLADGGDPSGPSLSPISLLELSVGDSVVLPSPNGSTCASITARPGRTVVASCLRNCSAVGSWLRAVGQPVAVIACGEVWPDGSFRPAVEDLVGAGAVLEQLGGRFSPEAETAVAAWCSARGRLPEMMEECASGRELIIQGRIEDVRYASQVNVSSVVPVLTEGAFRNAEQAEPDLSTTGLR